MKTILLMRHAKSDWNNLELADFDRPLAKRGKKDAPLMGMFLRQSGSLPDQIIASTAQRAKETAQLLAETGVGNNPILWNDSFYGGTSYDMLTALRQLPSTVECAILIGHNPILEETATLLLVGHLTPTNVLIQIPTAGLLCLDANTYTWEDLQPGQTVLRWFVNPKLVKTL